MNKTHQQPGTAQIIIDGLIPSETAKLRRHIERLGGHKIVANVYQMTCMGIEKLPDIKDKLIAKGTKETSIRLFYITAMQQSNSIIAHGKPS